MSIALDEGHRPERVERQTGADTADEAIEPVRSSGHLAFTTASQPDRVGVGSDRNLLAWPDKVGLLIAVFIGALSAIACLVVLIVSETMDYGRLNQTLAAWSGMVELGVALPAWLLMRAIDLVAGGPRRRRHSRAGHLEE